MQSRWAATNLHNAQTECGECGTGCQAAGHLPCHAGRVATACQWTTIRVQLHDSENAIEPRFPIYNQTRIAMTLKRFEEKRRKVSEAPTGCQSLQKEDERNSASETCGSRHGSTQKCHVRLQELHMAHILLNLEDQVRAVLHWSGYQRQQMRWYINVSKAMCFILLQYWDASIHMHVARTWDVESTEYLKSVKRKPVEVLIIPAKRRSQIAPH